MEMSEGFNNKQRRQNRRRNFVAKELNSNRYHQRIKGDKRKHLIDVLHEQEAEEDLHEYLELGKEFEE